MTKVLISIPTRENIHAETVGWLLVTMDKAAKAKLEIAVHILFSPFPLELQRNNQVFDFLQIEKDYTHLFLLDSDCVPPPGCIDKLLEYDLDIVASVAPSLSGGKHVFTAGWETGSKKIDERWTKMGVQCEEAHGIKKVDGVGATGVLIKRHVLEKIQYPWFKMIYSKDGRTMELGEDYYFCTKARKAGFEIYADFDLRQKHYKSVAL